MKYYVVSEGSYDSVHIHGIIEAVDDKNAERVARHLFGEWAEVEEFPLVSALLVRTCVEHPKYRGLVRPRVRCWQCDLVYEQTRERGARERQRKVVPASA